MTGIFSHRTGTHEGPESGSDHVSGITGSRAAQAGAAGISAAGLKSLLDELMAQVSVPGAAIALVSSDDAELARAGVSNLDHPLPVTDSTCFRIASITKTFTAHAVQAVTDAGTGLDEPVAAVLGPFRLARCIAEMFGRDQ